jgi:hypothetical protein
MKTAEYTLSKDSNAFKLLIEHREFVEKQWGKHYYWMQGIIARQTSFTEEQMGLIGMALTKTNLPYSVKSEILLNLFILTKKQERGV